MSDRRAAYLAIVTGAAQGYWAKRLPTMPQFDTSHVELGRFAWLGGWHPYQVPSGVEYYRWLVYWSGIHPEVARLRVECWGDRWHWRMDSPSCGSAEAARSAAEEWAERFYRRWEAP